MNSTSAINKATSQVLSVSTQVLAMQQTAVFVVGDLVLDSYIAGKVSRISPEAPVPVVHESSQRSVLGGAGNVAANIASFGAHAVLCGRLGSDVEGAHFKDLCTKIGIETRALLFDENLPTTRKTRVLAGYQQLIRLDREVTSALSNAHEQLVLSHFTEFLSRVGRKCVVLSDYGKGMLGPVLLRKLIELAKKANVPVVTDPKSVDLGRYSGSTIIKPNLQEGRDCLRALLPGLTTFHLEEEVDAICTSVMKVSQAENVVLSLSEHGVAVKTHTSPTIYRLGAHKLQVADVSGAGDTMISFLAMGLAAGIEVVRATELANIAAGVVCGKLGTATLSPSEFYGAFKETHEATAPEKVVSDSDASAVAAQYREGGRKIVFTNGCFDILHAGHVKLLQESRSQGDMLVVGLNSDASVQRLKGPTRPIQSAADRASILAGLSCVDLVVEYNEDIPLELIQKIRPHVLVKGGDYSADAPAESSQYIVGTKEVRSWGGEVKTLPLLEGRSTTGIVERSRGK